MPVSTAIIRDFWSGSSMPRASMCSKNWRWRSRLIRWSSFVEIVNEVCADSDAFALGVAKLGLTAGHNSEKRVEDRPTTHQFSLQGDNDRRRRGRSSTHGGIVAYGDAHGSLHARDLDR